MDTIEITSWPWENQVHIEWAGWKDFSDFVSAIQLLDRYLQAQFRITGNTVLARFQSWQSLFDSWTVDQQNSARQYIIDFSKTQFPDIVIEDAWLLSGHFDFREKKIFYEIQDAVVAWTDGSQDLALSMRSTTRYIVQDESNPHRWTVMSVRIPFFNFPTGDCHIYLRWTDWIFKINEQIWAQISQLKKKVVQIVWLSNLYIQ